MGLRRRKERTDQETSIHDIKSLMEGNDRKCKEVLTLFESWFEVFGGLLEAMVQVNGLLCGEEQDRKKIALVGYQSIGKRESADNIVKLDKNCVSCSGGSQATIQSAFKMACLAYQPGKVGYGGREFSREFLLEKNKSVIEKALLHFHRLNQNRDEAGSSSQHHVSGRKLNKYNTPGTELDY